MKLRNLLLKKNKKLNYKKYKKLNYKKLNYKIMNIIFLYNYFNNIFFVLLKAFFLLILNYINYIDFYQI